jgi:hypothetical protein
MRFDHRFALCLDSKGSMCGRAILLNRKSPRIVRRLMKVGGFFCAPGALSTIRIKPMSNRRPRKMSHEYPHRFDTRFIPTGDYSDDHIIVTRNSRLISAVSRKRPGEYRIWGGSFIGERQS